MKTRCSILARLLSVLARVGNSPRRLAASVTLSAAVFANSLQAQIVFDAGKDFSTNQNPNGAWSYGWWNASERLFMLYTNVSPLSAPSSPRIWAWDVPYSEPYGGPIFALSACWNPTDHPENILTMSLPPLGIQLHPGPGNEYSVIRWTAPSSAVVNINAAFEGLNPDGTTTDVHVWHNGTALYDASVNGFGLSSRVAFQGTATVVIGDTIDFGVGYGNGSHYSDSTLLEAAVTFKPSGGAIFLRQGLYSIVETNTSLPVQVLRVGPDFLDVPVTVDYATIEETAHAGEDFVATSGTLHFAAGETEKVISIPILNDALKESEEQFLVVLRNPTGGVSLGNSNLVIRIQSDELPDYYVNVANPNPVFPYTSWATAATNIQDAVDAGVELGRVVLVTNGVYRMGSVWVVVQMGFAQTRVELPSGVVLRSVNGPSVTLIEGAQGLDQSIDPIGCVYVGDGALVSGFTLTNGAAYSTSGGGAYCEPFGVVTNCVITGSSEFFGYGAGVYGGRLFDCTISNNSGGGADSSTLYNCTLTGTTATEGGGGARSSTLYNCSLTGNSATWGGGGTLASTLYNCTLTGNSTDGDGGGAHQSTLYGCTLTSNSTGGHGGGTLASTLYNCTLTGNSAGGDGGGAYQSKLYSCTLSGNTAQGEGGGTYGYASTLYNCTVTGNSAWRGGGAAGGTLYNCVVMGNSADYGGGVEGASYRWGYLPSQLRNCIVYSNQAPSGANHGYALFEYSCTSPLPADGLGNIDADPRFMNAATGDYRLLPDSPCIDTGTNLKEFFTTDLDSLPRPLDGNGDGVARFDMGAYEFNPYRFAPTLQLSPEGFRFTVRGEPGKSVRIERSRDLVHWEFAGQVPIPASGQTLIDPAATTERQLFYRVISIP